MKEIQKIASFTVDHTRLLPGIYVSRVDGDVVTYDLRTRVPNTDDLMDHVTMHTFEHMFATYVRNSEVAADVLYFGPMGCQTGFYLLVRDSLCHTQAIELVKESMAFARDFVGEIPGNKREECGNYLYHDLDGAKALAGDTYEVLKNWQEKDLQYK
jgi:S-ribosylhomocysteine lyase